MLGALITVGLLAVAAIQVVIVTASGLRHARKRLDKGHILRSVRPQGLASQGRAMEVQRVRAGDDDGRCGGGTPTRKRSVKPAGTSSWQRRRRCNRVHEWRCAVKR
jgi:hypothetical protein